MKALPRHMLDARGVHTALLQHILIGGGEILANHTDHPHLGKVAGGQRKMRCRPSQRMVHPAAWSLNTVERNATNHHNGHAGFFLKLTRDIFR